MRSRFARRHRRDCALAMVRENRIGHGFDAHRLAEGETLILGGVSIPYHQGTVAHSDGDVLLHAVADALLGALAWGDLGGWFPDSDAAFRGVNSRDLLTHIVRRVHRAGWALVNLDSTLVAQAPKLAPLIPQMRAHLAHDLSCSLSAVSVKATTTEKMGYTGRKEGLAAHAVVLLQKK